MDDATRLNQLAADLSPLITARFMDSGAWTPTYLGDATPGVTTYVGTSSGYWYRVGDLVTVFGRVEWSAATGTGSGIISLPFTVSNATNYRAPMTVSISLIVFPSGYVIGNPIAGTTTFSIVNVQSNVAAAALAIDTSGGIVAFAGVYAI